MTKKNLTEEEARAELFHFVRSVNEMMRPYIKYWTDEMYERLEKSIHETGDHVKVILDEDVINFAIWNAMFVVSGEKLKELQTKKESKGEEK
jgi:hypothetical protein